MNNFKSICEQFSFILKGKSKIEKNSCSVSLHRNFKVLVQGRLSSSVAQVEVLFESIDQNGKALCLSEIAILEEEIPLFMQSTYNQQRLIVSALHNHWLFTEPSIMYIHIQSIEPPLEFAKKMEHAFSFLKSYPVP
ncbi:DUF1259 domain-containing protein [Sutcliffiella rhizosphaerae]|uniref:DUF1259 domain-containing protein n=1 Tax=Sutcliffiella rhizosphaerae TaxID=2880967 RepID=A0ABM8YUP8_9BACI|nr:DUF1259 domain-containing protein [Sutcliffiella rhizosphaerae]CAG9623702.1 hypothetical protein BACCIP111883_04534 [Sutcliffiella rhizosphaerae]